MKNLMFFVLVFIALSCSEKKADLHTDSEDQQLPADYDTTAVDSFSTGATSVQVATRIRMSSRHYQDSLLLLRRKNEEEKLSKELTEMLEADRKKKELAAKKEAHAKTADNIPSEPVKIP